MISDAPRTTSSASIHLPPDLSFPYVTSAVSHTEGVLDGFQLETAQGYIRGEELARGLSLRPRTHYVGELEATRGEKIVTWKERDSEHPWNWSKSWRWYITAVASIAVIQVAMASAIVTGDFGDQAKYFDVSIEVMNLTVTLTVCGFGVGPLIWSPLSELVGRRLLWTIPFAIYVIFNVPCALAPNIGCLLASRFICGFFGSSPLTLAGGTIADVWGPNERGFAIAIFAAAPYTGPVIGPLIGGFIGKYAGWRWIYWVNMIMAGVVWFMSATIPETFAPVLLRRRAKKLRAETGDLYLTEQEEFRTSLTDIIIGSLIRPFQMLMTEPILLLMSAYISLVYGLLYAFFFAFPVVFNEYYGWDDAQTGLTFCGVLVGVALALLVTPSLERRYAAKGAAVVPEDRLPGMLVGGPFVPISLFIFGWTSPPYVPPHGASWLGPVSSGVPFGFGMVLVYFSANAYLIEAFPSYVASALAAKTVIRSAAGAAMPLFITQMFHALGNGGAASLLGGVAIIMALIPWAFVRYGQSIRARSKRAIS